MCSGRPRRNQSRAQSTCSKKESICWGKDPPGPSATARCSGPFNPAKRPGRGRRRAWAAHSTLDAARVSTRGRGSKREEGPQASTRIGRPDSVRSPPRVRSGGSAARLTGPPLGARAPRRVGPG
ncbi:hypothetical protein NDU88_000631 [Pleurodeles waltl]|uniref:Uncharacterized protein n=1 Tax=Pleurodeles waltl TaxID=8319 RepID=A0AAV7ML33_PLEWA|nr:hypothetical protein NDU88_000631 [Pleurodeles waltl]